MRMRKTILLAIVTISFVAGGTLLYFKSSLSLDTATATFSEHEESEHMNTLRIEAPYGYYVIHYDVVPRSLGGKLVQPPFKVGGGFIPQNPMGLFDDLTSHSTSFPPTGTKADIPVETHVLITSNLNTTATAVLPEDDSILGRCGTYLYVTKDRVAYEQLESMVASWTVDAAAGSYR